MFNDYCPGARIPTDPKTGRCWKYNHKAIKSNMMWLIEIDSRKKMKGEKN